MGDIVAMIQRQDEIIVAVAGRALVQGGPGTGKTAVALHWAAHPLDTHRFPLERQGVLVVGRQAAVPRYIEQVADFSRRDGRQPCRRWPGWRRVRVRGVDVPPSQAEG